MTPLLPAVGCLENHDGNDGNRNNEGMHGKVVRTGLETNSTCVPKLYSDAPFLLTRLIHSGRDEHPFADVF